MPVGAGLAVAGVGAVVGGVVSAKANNNATMASMKSNTDALAYQKEQDTYLRSRYELEDKREQEARAAYREYLASQGKGPSAAPGKVGLNYGGAPPPGQTGGGWDGATAPTLRDMAPGASTPPPPPALAGPAGAMDAPADVTTMPTLADVGKWNEWDPYLSQNRAQA